MVFLEPLYHMGPGPDHAFGVCPVKKVSVFAPGWIVSTSTCQPPWTSLCFAFRCENVPHLPVWTVFQNPLGRTVCLILLMKKDELTVRGVYVFAVYLV